MKTLAAAELDFMSASRASARIVIIWDPCAGLQPTLIDEPRKFLAGQVIVAAISLCLLGPLFGLFGCF